MKGDSWSVENGDTGTLNERRRNTLRVNLEGGGIGREKGDKG